MNKVVGLPVQRCMRSVAARGGSGPRTRLQCNGVGKCITVAPPAPDQTRWSNNQKVSGEEGVWQVRARVARRQEGWQNSATRTNTCVQNNATNQQWLNNRTGIIHQGRWWRWGSSVQYARRHQQSRRGASATAAVRTQVGMRIQKARQFSSGPTVEQRSHARRDVQNAAAADCSATALSATPNHMGQVRARMAGVPPGVAAKAEPGGRTKRMGKMRINREESHPHVSPINAEQTMAGNAKGRSQQASHQFAPAVAEKNPTIQ